jgi:hypothetical protein
MRKRKGNERKEKRIKAAWVMKTVGKVTGGEAICGLGSHEQTVFLFMGL